MEIHPPTKPIESVKDFLLHLSMITIGILIALGLEQAVEAWRHHELAVQAKESILNEIRDNKRELDRTQVGVRQNGDKMRHTLETVRLYLAHKPPAHGEMYILANVASLNSTSWTTATATGTLSYLGYADAQKFAGVYGVQALFERTQEEEMRTASAALALAQFGPGGPGTASDDQLRSLERGVMNCLAGITVWNQVAASLGRAYDRILKAESTAAQAVQRSPSAPAK